MRLNATQQKIILIAIGAVAVMGVFPPWIYTFKWQSIYKEEPAGYAFIGTPPDRRTGATAYGVKVDITRLLIQLVVVIAASSGGVLANAWGSGVQRNTATPDTPKFPKPDRSRHKPNRTKIAENDALDIGWQDGLLPDGRPFRAEMWALDGVSNLTIFVPAEGIDLSDRKDAAEYVEQTGLIHFHPGKRYCSAKRCKDDSGNEVWSINLVVGDEDETFIEDTPQLQPYPK